MIATNVDLYKLLASNELPIWKMLSGEYNKTNIKIELYEKFTIRGINVFRNNRERKYPKAIINIL